MPFLKKKGKVKKMSLQEFESKDKELKKEMGKLALLRIISQQNPHKNKLKRTQTLTRIARNVKSNLRK